MKKKQTNEAWYAYALLKTLRIMRLTLGLLLITIVQGWAINSYSQKVTINLDLKNADLIKVLDEIENQTDFYFLFNYEQVHLDKKFDVKLSGSKIDEALKQILDGTGLDYQINNRQIVITKEGIEQLNDESGPSTQQKKSINGKVVDFTGVSLPGVTVVVKGTTNGTITDIDGKYSLNNIPANATLQFSFVGMKTQEMLIGDKIIINVTLAEETVGIEEVVAVGYGTQKRVNVIGSVSQISEEKIANRPVTSLSNALAGQMSGVTVIQRSGEPGADQATMRIRGVGSFGASPDALILVDGIPGSMEEINMNDIETISVLKDASSAAIYGARAANGVVLITTKSGKEGKLNVRYDGSYGISTPTAFPELVNSWDYAAMTNIAAGSEIYPSAEIAKYKAQNDPDNYPNTDFLKKVFSRNGTRTSHEITISGGQNINKYFFSFGYLNETGLVVHNDYERYNLRLNLKSQLRENLTLNTRISGSTEELNEPNTVAAVNGSGLAFIASQAIRYPSISLGQASNGDFGDGPYLVGTPVSWLASQSYYHKPTTKAGVNSRLDWNPLKELTISAIGGYSFTLNELSDYEASQILNPNFSLPASNLNQYKNKGIYKTMQFLAEYSKIFKGHELKVLTGYSFEDQVNNNFSGRRQDFPSNSYTVMSMGGVDNQQVYGDISEWAIQSLFGRLNYNYKGKYLFESTVRYDGSSRFPDTKKYGTFPSAAVGWRVAEEDFFKQAVPWVSNLKLKASWGILGNQNIGNYPYQATMASGTNYTFGNTVFNGAQYKTFKDPNIHWESTETKDLGIETGFFGGKLSLNATYFYRFTRDILYKPSSSVSTVLGLSLSETNTGQLLNKGWEFEIGHQNKFGDFSYNIQGNLSIIHNEVRTLGLGNVEQPNGLIGNGSSLFIGYPMNMYYGYKSDGVFTSKEDIANWADQSKVTPNAQPGDIRYKDISGPNGVPDGKVDPTYDRTYLGSAIPKYTFSFNLSTKYKNFDLSVFLQGITGVKGMLTEQAGFAFYNNATIQKWQMDGRFNPDNPVRYPAYPRLELLTLAGTPNTQTSDFWTLNASYLRIKNIQFGYTLPTSALKTIHINQLRVYISAENLFTFDHYRPGWDPETYTNGEYYPILAKFTMGVNVKF